MFGDVLSVISPLIAAGTVIWYLSSAVATLKVTVASLQEDIEDLKGAVSQLKDDMARVQTYLQPERISSLPSHKGPRRR